MLRWRMLITERAKTNREQHDSSLPRGWAPHPAQSLRDRKCQNFSCRPVSIKDWNSRDKAKILLLRQMRWQRGCSVPCRICQRQALAAFRTSQTSRTQGSQSVPFCRGSAPSLGRHRQSHATRAQRMTEIKGKLGTFKALCKYPNI